MVVFMCDACVFAVMRFSTELWYRRIYGLVSKHIRTVVFVATNITNNLILQHTPMLYLCSLCAGLACLLLDLVIVAAGTVG